MFAVLDDVGGLKLKQLGEDRAVEEHGCWQVGNVLAGQLNSRLKNGQVSIAIEHQIFSTAELELPISIESPDPSAIRKL